VSTPELLPWQQAQWSQVSATRAGGRLPHAFLLAGPRGVGKRQFAQRLAAWLLCEVSGAQPCGECRGCVQFGALSHPNLMVLRPEEDRRDISVDAVRELSERLSLTAHYGGNKVAIIEPADALNANGVNALLKTIEEPPAGSYLLLLTDRPMLLAPTLRSRCQFLRFGVPPKEKALAWLRSRNPAANEALLQAAHGAPIRALELLEEKGLERHAQWQRAVEAIATGQESPLGLANGMDKADASRFLEWLLAWVVSEQRTLAVGGPGKLSEAARRLGAPGLDRIAQAALRTLQQLQQNAPPQLAVESIIIRLWQWCRVPIQEMRA